MKRTIKYVIILIIMMVFFCTTLTLTSLIPKNYIEKNVKESAEILNEQTDRYYVPIHFKKILMLFDNYTDSLMINTAYSINNKTPFYSSMVARKNYIEGVTKTIHTDEVGELKSSKKYIEFTQVGDLNDTVNNNTEESFEYARYWHGYLIFLRPLLIIFNITQIRILMYLILSCLAVILLYKLWKKINIQTSLLFLFGLIICDYFFVGLSLQGSPVFLITMIASIILLSYDIKDKGLFFFIVGGITSFFDFLTVPIITLGIPLLIDIMLQDNKKITDDLKTIFKNCLMWGISYLSVFASKWVLIDVIFNKHLIITAFEQIKYRTLLNRTDNPISLKEVFVKNSELYLFEFLVTFLITLIFFEIKIIRNKKNIKTNFKKTFIYWIIGCLGILWYTILKQHSYQHYYFTYRNSFLIVVAFLIGIYNAIKIKTGEIYEKDKNSGEKT